MRLMWEFEHGNLAVQLWMLLGAALTIAAFFLPARRMRLAKIAALTTVLPWIWFWKEPAGMLVWNALPFTNFQIAIAAAIYFAACRDRDQARITARAAGDPTPCGTPGPSRE